MNLFKVTEEHIKLKKRHKTHHIQYRIYIRDTTIFRKIKNQVTKIVKDFYKTEKSKSKYHILPLQMKKVNNPDRIQLLS